MRAHGSVSYGSILRGTSHGCHRLYNHLAVRLTGFLVRHRAHIRRGSIPARYLRDLVDAGVNVVDTSFIEPGDPIELPVGVEFVVKPTVSAGSRDTVRYHADDHTPATAQIEATMIG